MFLGDLSLVKLYMSTNNMLIDIYMKLQTVLSGCKHISDAHSISDIFSNKYPDFSNMIGSIVNGKQYENIISNQNIKSTIADIDYLKYMDEADDLIDVLKESRNITDIQKRTFIRLSKTKPVKAVHFCDIEPKVHYIEKLCPHCGHKTSAVTGATHVVCGYTNETNGYDFVGCGKDWCFDCGKLLCKSWHNNHLYRPENRTHDNECCLEHAKATGKDYTKEFCQCQNDYVNRIDPLKELNISFDDIDPIKNPEENAKIEIPIFIAPNSHKLAKLVESVIN